MLPAIPLLPVPKIALFAVLETNVVLVSPKSVVQRLLVVSHVRFGPSCTPAAPEASNV